MENWIKEMKKAMAMISKTCKKNDDWSKCKKCPFDEYCTALMVDGLVDPFEGPFTPPSESRRRAAGHL